MSAVRHPEPIGSFATESLARSAADCLSARRPPRLAGRGRKGSTKMQNLVEKFTPAATEATDEDGVVAIEYVVMAILVLVSFLGVKAQAANAARDGARAAALDPTWNPPAGAGLSFVGARRPAPRDTTKSVVVRSTKSVSLRNIPILGNVLPSTIGQEVTMRCGG